MGAYKIAVADDMRAQREEGASDHVPAIIGEQSRLIRFSGRSRYETGVGAEGDASRLDEWGPPGSDFNPNCLSTARSLPMP